MAICCKDCSYRKRGKGKEPEIDAPGLGEFILEDRKPQVKALERYLSGYRRGIFVISGDPGTGKSKLLLNGVKGDRHSWRITKSGIRRRLLAVWMDPNLLGISSMPPPMLRSGERVKASEKQEKDNPGSAGDDGGKTDQINGRNHPGDFLLHIVRAMINHLSPHWRFRRSGKGLITKIGSWWYYFSYPRNVSRGFQLQLSSWFHDHILNTNSLKQGCKDFFNFYVCQFCLIMLSLIPPVLVCAIAFELLDIFFARVLNLSLGNYFIPGGGQSLSLTSFYLEYPTWLLLLLICIPAGWVLTRFLFDLWPIMRRANRLRQLAFANEYTRTEKSGNLFELVGGKAPKKGLSAKWFFKQHELAVYSRDIPNLLRELFIFLFQLHRIGIEPVLIIDELDKLIPVNRRPEADQDEPKWDKPFRHWNWECWRWFRENGGIDRIYPLYGGLLDNLVRFKESLGRDLAVILVSDLRLTRVLEESRGDGSRYHTMVKEQILLGPVSLKAWQEVFWKLLNRCPPICVDREADAIGTNKICPGCTKEPDHCPLKEDDSAKKIAEQCASFRQWSKLIWIKGRGRYADMIFQARSYRQQGWPEESLAEDLKWCDDVVRDLIKFMEDDSNKRYGTWFPGKPIYNNLDVEMQKAVFNILSALLDHGSVTLPVSLSDKATPGENRQHTFFYHIIKAIDPRRLDIVELSTEDKEKLLDKASAALAWKKYSRSRLKDANKDDRGDHSGK